MSENTPKLAAQEQMKRQSGFLKGNIASELADSSLHEISTEAYELLKFHGTYFGHNRDTATERKKQGLEKEYEFMVRTRIPAGRLSAQQYLGMDAIADKHANGTLRITTRQVFQFHVILKDNLKAAIADINHTLLSTLGGCGDVVRNVTTSPSPVEDARHQRLRDDAEKVAAFVRPKTSSYKELWLDEEADEVREREANSPAVTEGTTPSDGETYEPLYGSTYLPRKFKIGLITPDDNSIDVFTHDLGFILIFEGDTLKGYNIVLGGGMGMKHEGKLAWEEKKTYPRLATPIAFAGPDDLLNVVEAVLKLQRDHGDRTDRQHARLKYVVQENGVEWTRKTLEAYFAKTNPSQPLQDFIPVDRYNIPTHMGWHEQGNGTLFLGLPIPSGRIMDYGEGPHQSGYNTGKNRHFAQAKYRTALRELATTFGKRMVLTPTEEVILCDIAPEEKTAIEDVLKQHHIPLAEDHTPSELHFMTCVALPTCAKALSESERVQFPIIDGIQAVLKKHGLEQERLTIRVTGCPNGCARPYVGDIGIVGRMPGHYVLFIGGDFEGTRLNVKVFDKIPLDDIPKALDPMFALFAKERQDGEGFGDFCHRYGEEAVAEVAAKANPDAKWAA